MAGIEQPPAPPQVQEQMGGGPQFGAGMAKAASGMDKSPAQLAVDTVEKILLGVQDETFRPYAQKAIANLKVGLSMANSKGPQSPGMASPPKPGEGGAPGAGPQVSGPPVPGQMPG